VNNSKIKTFNGRLDEVLKEWLFFFVSAGIDGRRFSVWNRIKICHWHLLIGLRAQK